MKKLPTLIKQLPLPLDTKEAREFEKTAKKKSTWLTEKEFLS